MPATFYSGTFYSPTFYTDQPVAPPPPPPTEPATGGGNEDPLWRQLARLRVRSRISGFRDEDRFWKIEARATRIARPAAKVARAPLREPADLREDVGKRVADDVRAAIAKVPERFRRARARLKGMRAEREAFGKLRASFIAKGHEDETDDGFSPLFDDFD